MAASVKTELQIFEEEHAANIAGIDEEHKLALAKTKAALEVEKRKKQFRDEMAELEAQMAALRPLRPLHLLRPQNYAAVAAAGGGGAEEQVEERPVDHDEEDEEHNDEEHHDEDGEEVVEYKLFGFCNNYINGIKCEHGDECRYNHPEGDFKLNKYNFPKKRQIMPDGSSRDYRLMGFCVNTLNGRHCKINKCQYTHPKGYQCGEIPEGTKRKLGTFSKGDLNWPTA